MTIDIKKVDQSKEQFSMEHIMFMLQDIFDSSEIIILTANKEKNGAIKAGLHTYCADETVIEGMLRLSL